jgi:hypothetical protein
MKFSIRFIHSLQLPSIPTKVVIIEEAWWNSYKSMKDENHGLQLIFLF